MRSFTIKFLWIPGQKCMQGNELADTKAKEAASFGLITKETKVSWSSCTNVFLA